MIFGRDESENEYTKRFIKRKNQSKQITAKTCRTESKPANWIKHKRHTMLKNDTN